jgi:hypothetical protein
MSSQMQPQSDYGECRMFGPLTGSDAARSVILAVVIPLAAYEIFYGPSAPVNVGAAVIMAIGLFSVRKLMVFCMALLRLRSALPF